MFSEVRTRLGAVAACRLGASERKEEEVREMHCPCGQRLVARDDESLVQLPLIHARDAHPEITRTEEQAREMVASQATDREDPS